MDFISYLSENLNEDICNISRNFEYSNFDFIGFRGTNTSLNLFALVKSDDLTEKKMISIRDEFFDITQSLPKEFDLKNKFINPTGLLCFVFEHQCSSKQFIKFITNLSKISHWAGGVVVTWLIDCESTKIYTHKNPVSKLPPVIVLPNSTYPCLSYLEGFLSGYSSKKVNFINEKVKETEKKKEKHIYPYNDT